MEFPPEFAIRNTRTGQLLQLDRDADGYVLCSAWGGPLAAEYFDSAEMAQAFMCHVDIIDPAEVVEVDW